MNKLLYCVTDEGWHTIKVASFSQAIAEIRLLLASGEKVQEFTILLNSDNPILFEVRGNMIILNDIN